MYFIMVGAQQCSCPSCCTGSVFLEHPWLIVAFIVSYIVLGIGCVLFTRHYYINILKLGQGGSYSPANLQMVSQVSQEINIPESTFNDAVDDNHE